MSHTRHRLLAIVLPLFIAMTSTFALILVANAQVEEQPASPTVPSVRYVAVTGNDNGNDCAISASPCASLQRAVSLAVAGNEVRVAEGVFQGTQTISRTLFGEVYSYTQVLYIDKPLTIRGGYSTADWASSDPAARPTVIDAQRNGRGVTIIDTLDEPVNLEGFTITGGDYSGLGNPPGVSNYVCGYRGYDCGGGLLIVRSAANLRHLTVWDNTGGRFQNQGGGIYLDNSRVVTIEDSRIISNSAQFGGGLFADDQRYPLTIRHSLFQGNTAEVTGGAINIGDGVAALVTIETTDILSNTASATTSGIEAGAGVYIRMAQNGLTLSMNRVRLQNNRGGGLGKAMHMHAAGNYTPTARLSNILLSGNGSPAGAPVTPEDAVITVGPGFTNFNAHFSHVTAAGNEVAGFLYAEPYDAKSIQVVLTNTLLSGFDNGFVARQDGSGEVTIQHRNTLFENVANQHLNLGGSPAISATNPISGNAMLNETFHLQQGSEAIDAGLPTDVTDDIDGQFRPQYAGPDIGADEYLRYFVYLPLAQR